MNIKNLWTADELADCFDLPGFATSVTGISIDTRTLDPGDLFIALSGDPGPRFGGGRAGARDGHDFLEAAIAAGARAVMVHKASALDVPAIRVKNTLDGLWQLARAARRRFMGKTLALTGSSGKTTLRGWLEQVLSVTGSCHASTGSLNNHWGVPLSLSRMPASADFGILEVGTNRPSEIAPLSDLVQPNVALLLNVQSAHIGNFANPAALATEKLSIASGLSAEGVLILPAALRERAETDRLLAFGEEREGADVFLVAATPESGGTHLKISVQGRTHDCFMPFFGAERIESVLALTASLLALEVDLQQVLPAYEDLTLPGGRGNVRMTAGVAIIDDSYNANPASMVMSLRSFARQTGRNKYIFLGEMLELGEASPEHHQAVAKEVGSVAGLYTFGEGFRDCSFPSAAQHFNNVSEFDIQAFVAKLQPGDMVLVKGSNKVFWQKGFTNKLVDSLQDI